MRSVLGLVLVAVSTMALVGCAAEPAQAPPTAAAASPQQAEVSWVESAPAEGPALVFEVERIEITVDGWRADVAIRNETQTTWGIIADATSRFGVMLFVTGELSELERRNAEQDLPGLRVAREVVPPLPGRLEPGDVWEGSLSAPGSLAATRFLRVVFGPLLADDAPGELPPQLVWITDHAYRLRP